MAEEFSELVSQSLGCVILLCLKEIMPRGDGPEPFLYHFFQKGSLGKGTKRGQWGDAAPLQFEKLFSLSCASPAPLILFSLSVSYSAFSLLFPCILSALFSLLFPLKSIFLLSFHTLLVT